jgi:heme-degrading monooxygenase HmoA
MVLELALVDVLPGHEEAFVADLDRAAAEVLPRAEGFISFTAHGWCVERPTVFMFTITWRSLADHTEGFRGSDLFVEWRSHIGAHFAAPPVVEHFG